MSIPTLCAVYQVKRKGKWVNFVVEKVGTENSTGKMLQALGRTFRVHHEQRMV